MKLFTDLCVDFVGDLASPARRVLETFTFDGNRGPVKCDPHHDFRMDEVLPAPADLPNAFTRLPPSGR
jgi:hypothetical protein